MPVHEIKNPIVKHKLTQLRRKETPSKIFRELVKEIAALMIYEIGENFPSREVEIETPLQKCGIPKDIAKCVCWIVDDEFTTGQVISINGGWIIT